MLEMIVEAPGRATGWMDDSGTFGREAELSARLNRLDRGAWKSFYLEHRRLVSAVLATLIGYADELDDVVQEVFVTALSLVRCGRVRLKGDEAGVRAWLLAITRRLARAEARRRRTSRTRQIEYDWESHGAAPPDPALAQALRRAEQLLGGLPDRLRIPWVLRNLERMTIEEVALATGVSMATVKRRVGRAEGHFRQLALRDPVVQDYLRHGDPT
jgi:RNA polymerase sigma-70 factor (ECF subfamily)